MLNQNPQELITKIKQLEEELRKVKSCKRYGLVWDEKPEIFEQKAKDALPILKENKSLRIEDSEQKPNNIIIEGDNFHSLSVLNYTHKGKIDVIYIDPPYNTGKIDFIYNDKFVDYEDSYRHSKWLSFMNKRLKLAKELLNEEGVIFISIDDNELYNLKLLCDEIFGEKNFIANLSVENNPKGRKNSKFVSISNDYCLIYAKNKENEKLYFLENIPKNIKELKKDNLGRYYSSGKRVLVGESTNKNIENFESKKHYSVYYNKQINDLIILKEKNINDINKDLIDKGYIRYISSKGNNFIENTYTKEEFLKLFKNNALIFKNKTIYEKDFNTCVRIKSLLLNDVGKGIDLKTETAGKQLNNLGLDFSNPKNYKFLRLIFSLINNKNSTILDFFAGSGTTGHAVMELNKEDGGNRQFILCSSRENTKEEPDKNICKDITYERNKRVILGYTDSKGKKIEGLGGNLNYYTTEFIKVEKSIDDLRYKFINMCDDLLCVKENTFTKIPFTPSPDRRGLGGGLIKLFKKQNKFTAILYDVHFFDDLKDILKNINGEISVYIFSLSNDIFEEELIELNKNITLQNIPDPILETYKKIFNF